MTYHQSLSAYFRMLASHIAWEGPLTTRVVDAWRLDVAQGLSMATSPNRFQLQELGGNGRVWGAL